MRVLLTRLSALGDIVHTWPLVAALGRSGAFEVAWLVEEPFLPLVAAHPGVARAITVATRRWRRSPLSRRTRDEIASVRRQVAAFRPEVALDPQGLLKSAVWAWMAAVPRRVGFAGPLRRERLAGAFYTERVTAPGHVRHVIDLNLALLTALAIAPEYGAVPDAGFLLGSAGRPAPTGATVLLPGAGGSGKRWGREEFAALARRVAASGRRVAVAWGPGERELAGEIVAGAGAGVEAAPPTTIAELARLLAGADAVVGGDTGPIHLAAALGTPTVAIHIATDPERNAPRGPHVNIVTSALTGARHGRARAGSDGRVTVEEVLRALEAFSPVGESAKEEG